jgi:alkanesulfonate monooxygenase SsuD/methylene tetrahydromethanopterin reductase-like flavin-dependent oxidoreductase (luciferase family)
MARARRDLTFGISLVPNAGDHEALVDLAQRADRAGLAFLGIQDHPYQRRFLDTFALMAVLLARTERIRVFPDVANLPLRPPPLLAKAAASLDVVSGGRFELGIGAGGFREQVSGMGGPELSAGESVDALREAIGLIRRAWEADGELSHEGEHYRLPGYKPGPAPAHPIGIWVGAYKPRMLRLVGELADGWVPSLMRDLTPARLGELDRKIDEAAEAAGRDPSAVRRIWNVMAPLPEPAELASWAAEHGVDTFVFWPSDDDPAAQVETFAADVAPAVREALG